MWWKKKKKTYIEINKWCDEKGKERYKMSWNEMEKKF